MLKLCLLLLILLTKDGWSQEQEELYKGMYIGDLNTYANQVSGEVYAVDDWTLLMVNFFYNGQGRDTYFWAGENGRSGPQGFIVPDEYGTTNILERYNGSTEFTLRLPGGKRISRIKWLAVFDIDSQNVFGDVYVPPDFDAPAPRAAPALAGPGASSGPLVVLDAQTILITELRYAGDEGEVYFWVGVGPQPSARGQKVPDENGYLEPLRAYRGENVTLVLPGGLSVRALQWLSVWSATRGASLAHAALPEALNVPAALPSLHPYRSELPHCKQLHRDYQVSWDVFGNQITIQLAAKLGADEYMAFGVSGSTERSQMRGADVAVAWYDARLQRGLALDYNITDEAPCGQVLGAWRGVCPDERLGAQDNHQVISAQRSSGLTVVTYRRSLQPADTADREFSTVGETYVVWALGALGAWSVDGADDDVEPALAPGYHWARGADLSIDVANANGTARPSDCFPFTTSPVPAPAAWSRAALTEPALRSFDFVVGPSGGRRGQGGRAEGRGGPALAWYVNGQLAPDVQVRRGLRYSLRVRGGDDPHSARAYHPLAVYTQRGGRGRALAGVRAARRGRGAGAAAGPLCEGRATTDRRREDAYDSFRAYNRSLQWSCEGATEGAELLITPDSSWPDLVYYDSFTHPGMGGRMFVVDRSARALGRRASRAAPPAGASSLTLLTLTLAPALPLTLLARG